MYILSKEIYVRSFIMVSLHKMVDQFKIEIEYEKIEL